MIKLTTTRTILAAAFMPILLPACKLAVITTDGGHVESLSTTRDCAPDSVCTFRIEDTEFHEAFTAAPAHGYAFSHWIGGERFVCADSTEATCTVSLIEDAAAQAIVDSGETYHAMPKFVLVDMDTDSDGIRDGVDPDDDNDGVNDTEDACPLDPYPLCGVNPAIHPIVAGENDAEETGTEVVITNSTLNIVAGTSVGLKFENIIIPTDSYPSEAYIEFTQGPDYDDSGETLILIQIEDTVDSPAFTTADNAVDGRTYATTNTLWTVENRWYSDETYRSPDIVQLIYTAIDSAPVDTELSLSFRITNLGDYDRNAHAFESDPQLAPRLIIHYYE